MRYTDVQLDYEFAGGYTLGDIPRRKIAFGAPGRGFHVKGASKDTGANVVKRAHV